MKSRHFILLLALASPFANAMNAIFWQPQIRDNSISQEKWRELMKGLQQEGVDTLVLQWTRYGDAFSSPTERQHLQQRTADARAAGLAVIIGLYADPEFFQRQKQKGAARDNYLNRLRIADVQQARIWSGYGNGWYISAEIDDLNWRNPEAREQLLQWLSVTRSQLKSIDDKPVYVSSFFAGNMAPDDYRRMLTEIHNRGVQVWVQDGEGVGKMSVTERQRYLDASAGCQSVTPASGIVHEIFKIIPGKTFNAVPLPDSEQKVRMARKSECGKDRLYFSLRYMPQAKGMMNSQ